MTLDELDQLEKSATSLPWKWGKAYELARYSKIYGGNGAEVVMDDGSAGDEYSPEIEPESENGRLIPISRNILPEVIAVARAIELAESFASQDVWQEGDLWAIIFAYREFKKKLGEQ